MFVIIWEYRVPEAKRREFERAYGADGRWAEFFRSGDGYLRTELLRNVDQPDRYVTLDFWRSEDDSTRFTATNRAEYDRIDRETALLTSAERMLVNMKIPE